MPDLDALLASVQETEESLAVRGLSRETLAAIAADHIARTTALEGHAPTLVTTLSRASGVHSLRARVKDPDRLLRKVIRKAKPETDPITVANYRDRVTDLLGARALHLYKSEWEPIHRYIQEHYDLHEDPFAYVRNGDSDEVQEAYRKAGLRVEVHDKGYRSVHYLVRFAPTKERIVAEVQVRTIFEEGWSEIDHRVRYPDYSDDPLLAQFLAMFNRLAGSADEMGTFVQDLATAVREYERRVLRREMQLTAAEEKMRVLIGQLAVSEEKKRALEVQLGRVTATSGSLAASPAADTGLAGGISALGSALSSGYYPTFAQLLKQVAIPRGMAEEAARLQRLYEQSASHRGLLAGASEALAAASADAASFGALPHVAPDAALESGAHGASASTPDLDQSGTQRTASKRSEPAPGKGVHPTVDAQGSSETKPRRRKPKAKP